jgi:membrane protease YdiL (CAAX protease family)
VTTQRPTGSNAPLPGEDRRANPYSDPMTRPGEDHLLDVSVGDGLVLVAWSLVGQTLLGIVVFTVMRAAGVDVAALAGASLGATLVVIVSVTMAGSLAWLAGRGKISWRLLGSQRLQLRHVGNGVLWGFVALMASFLIVYVGTLPFVEAEDVGQSLLEPEMLTGGAFVLTLLLAGLLAPLLEELTFRSVLFQSLGRRIGWLPSAVVSSVVFAVVHVEVYVPFRGEAVVFLLALATVGFVFAVAFHRERNLVTAIVAHATFNIVQLTFAAATVTG